jgi:hypothetical protein
MAASVVRLQGSREANCLDLGPSFKESPGNPVHAVHDAPVVAEDDRIGGVDLRNQLGVLDDFSDGSHFGTSIEPV